MTTTTRLPEPGDNGPDNALDKAGERAAEAHYEALAEHVHTGPTLPTLSAEAIDDLILPLQTDGGCTVHDGQGNHLFSVVTHHGAFGSDREIAKLFCAIINAALAPST